MSTKLKLLGVDVASVGDCFARTPGAEEIVFTDPMAGVYKKLVVSGDGTRILGGVLVGDAAAYASVLQYTRGDIPAPPGPERLILPAGDGEPVGLTPGDLPDAATICSCHNVTKGAICGAIAEGELADVGAIKGCTKAGTGCGSCVPVLTDLLHDELRKSGREVVLRLCEHFDQTRVELFEILRVTGIRTFAELVARFGRGTGCEICKPAVGVDAGLAEHRLHPRRRAGDAPGHQRPRSSPTCSATAPTRWCPGCRAARSRPTSSSPSARSPATSTSTRRSPVASGSTCSAPGSTSSRPSGGA